VPLDPFQILDHLDWLCPQIRGAVAQISIESFAPDAEVDRQIGLKFSPKFSDRCCPLFIECHSIRTQVVIALKCVLCYNVSVLWLSTPTIKHRGTWFPERGLGCPPPRMKTRRGVRPRRRSRVRPRWVTWKLPRSRAADCAAWSYRARTLEGLPERNLDFGREVYTALSESPDHIIVAWSASGWTACPRRPRLRRRHCGTKLLRDEDRRCSQSQPIQYELGLGVAALARNSPETGKITSRCNWPNNPRRGRSIPRISYAEPRPKPSHPRRPCPT